MNAYKEIVKRLAFWGATYQPTAGAPFGPEAVRAFKRIEEDAIRVLNGSRPERVCDWCGKPEGTARGEKVHEHEFHDKCIEAMDPFT